MLPFLQQINQQYSSYHDQQLNQSTHNHILWFKQLQQWNNTYNNPNNPNNNQTNHHTNLDNPYHYLYNLLYFYFSYDNLQTTHKINVIQQYQHQLQHCYGHLYRHKSLGYKHFDKSIYIDQLIRWFIIYPPHSSQFIFLSSSLLLTQTKQSIVQLLSWLLPNETIEFQQIINQINLNKQLLKDPNQLSKQYRLSSEIIQSIDNYYQPYEYALQFLRNSLQLTWIE